MLAHHGLEVFNSLERDILFCFAKINECSSIRAMLWSHYFYGGIVIRLAAFGPLMTC